MAVLSLALFSLSQASSANVGAQSPQTLPTFTPSSEVNVSGFHPVSSNEGWILLNERARPQNASSLHWTWNGGDAWSEITPPLGLGGSDLRAVFFLDSRHGWVVSTNLSQEFAISRTADTGGTWQTHSLAVFPLSDPAALPAAVHLFFLDAQTGWLVVRHATSSNFDMGTLFRTNDGGDSWTRLSIPFGDPVYFATKDAGWTVGGAGRTRLYATRDGGRTWQPVSPLRGDEGASPQLPRFSNSRDGVLPVIMNTRLELYRTQNGGETWEPGGAVQQAPLLREISPGSRAPISILSNGSAIVATTHGIRELDMATDRFGWAKSVEGGCERGDKTRCTQTTRLLRTADGGRTWHPLELPVTSAPSLSQPSIASSPRTAAGPTPFTVTVTGQGFDSCGLPSPSQFQNWWLNSPYLAYNLYIGGSALASCDPLSASIVSGLASQGWKFFPTWVGPQAPCYAPGYTITRMSYDANTAFNQGIAEANSALDAAFNLGLTDASKSGTVIYYDVEGYNTNDSSCRAAVNSFIRGWSYQLKLRGNVAGAYGAACGSAVSDWANTDPGLIPNVLWLAWWQVPYQYRSGATVWGAPCLSDTLWVNHQRLRQYAGGHDETWGGVTRNIDSDVLDGVVASLSNIFKPLYKYIFPLIRK